jgi:GNAT superfamily N-acetyltransferase
MDFEYKQLSSSLLRDLHYLFRISGKRISFFQMQKKYDTKRFGSEYIGFIAYDASKNLPVGFYGVLPVEAIYFGKKITIAQSADTITHPDYRKLGIFKNLAEKTYELCLKSGINLLFGIPNYNSYHGFIKYLDWEDKGIFLKFTKKISTIPVNAFVNKLKIFQPIYFSYIKLILLLFGKSNKLHFKNFINHEFFIPFTPNYRDYKVNNGKFEVEIRRVKLIFSFKGYMKIGMYDTSEGDFSSINLRLKLIAILSGSHKIVFQKLDSLCDENTKNDFSSYSISEGLPFIQKKIFENRINDDLLNINYFDFDTF